jgi:sulfite reductase alpha subunit-like flavoprotein
MSKPVADYAEPLVAHLVHRSVLVEGPGLSPVLRLMLNVVPDGRRFEPGTDVGFQPPGQADAAGLRHYTVDAVGEVPFEDSVDLTLHVRDHANPSSVAGMLAGLAQGDQVPLYGPFPYPFYAPMGSRSNMILIGAGCGMVPFRWLARKVQSRRLDWMGKVLMLHGERTGLEHLYQNDPDGDRDQFFDMVSYRAFEALKTRYSAAALDSTESIERNMEALWRLLGQGSVFVYLAGYRRAAAALDQAMSEHLRLSGRWLDAKADLVKGGHWLEHLYE